MIIFCLYMSNYLQKVTVFKKYFKKRFNRFYWNDFFKFTLTKNPDASANLIIRSSRRAIKSPNMMWSAVFYT